MRTKIGMKLYSILILLGTIMFFYGGFDDIPGRKLLGLVMIASGVGWIVKNRKKSDEHDFPPEIEP